MFSSATRLLGAEAPNPRAGLSGEGLRLGGLYLEGTVGMKGDLDRDRRLDLGDGDGERERGEAEREDRR